MTSRERFLTAIVGGVPDRVPATPDTSNYIPAKRTGLPFWDVYFFRRVPLWRAYLDTADHFGFDAWVGSVLGPPLRWDNGRVEWKTDYVLDPSRDAMVKVDIARTPDGDLTAETVCPRFDPPTPTVKLIKDLAKDFKKFRWLEAGPTGLDEQAASEHREECRRRGHAYGFCVGYPGFQAWQSYTQGGVEPLAFAWADTPAILDEWFELDLANGIKTMELAIAARPDYITFGGSGTITLASPALAMKYAIPAIARFSAMTKAAGIPTVLHSCGKSRVLVDMLAEHTDVDCVNPLEVAPMGDVDLAEVKAARGRSQEHRGPGRIVLMGNLHTTEVMLRGTPELVRDKSLQAMRDAGKGGGFVLSTGDQCGRETPDANLHALVESARQFGQYDSTGHLPAVEE